MSIPAGRPRRPRTCLVLGVLTSSLLLAAGAGARTKREPCAPGRFVQSAAVVPDGTAVAPEVVELSASRQLSVASACPAMKAKVKATRQGTRVTAKAKTCGGLKRARVKATFDDECNHLVGTLRAKGAGPFTIDARRTRCGDGIVDDANGEACEPPASPGCTEECLVETTTTSTTTSTTTTTTMLAASTTTTTTTLAPTTSTTTSTVPAVCGNGAREMGEECDDGNLLDGDDCSSDCTLTGLDAEALIEASCNFLARCEPARLTFARESLEDCKARVAISTLDAFAVTRAAIAAGRSLFDQDAFDACLTGLGSGDCHTFEPVCHFITGVLAAGEGCNLSTECDPELFCDADEGECGTCQPRAGVGDDCSTSVCVDGAACLDVGGDVLCIRDDLAEDAACGTITTGICRGHLQCVGTTTPTCERPAAHEAPCDILRDTGPDCSILEGQMCVSQECVDVAFSTPSGSCAGANVCDVDGSCDSGTDTCTALPTAGASCLFGTCAPGHFCNGTTCEVVRSDGASCTFTGQCELPLICAGAPGTKTCRARQFDACP